MSDLHEKIVDHSALVGVIGLGYVGLPATRRFWEAGFDVLGFDVDPEKIRLLERGQTYLTHLGRNYVGQMLRGERGSGRFEPTANFDRLGEPDVLLLCVPTPLGAHQEPNLQYVERTVEAVGRCLRPSQLVILVSTTYPGTTREVVLPRLSVSGLQCGEDFYLAYCPEREDPGGQSVSTDDSQSMARLVGALEDASLKHAAALFDQTRQQAVAVSSSEVAEAAKLLENIYRAVNVALVNELKVLLDALNIDVWEVIDAASTKPFGFQRFNPGPGLGGHCIPIDPFYLAWKAREVNQPTRFIELAGQVNHHMPEYVVSRVMLVLNRQSKAVRGAKMLVLGLAYKADVDDVRESPSFALIRKLCDLGAAVDYHDPHVPTIPATRGYPELARMASIELTAQALGQYDCVLIATAHSAYHWPWIARHANLVVDTRGVMRNLDGPNEHIVSA